MPSLARRVLLAALAASAASCGATVEIPRFCITQSGLAIPGAPVAGSITSPAFTVDVGGQIPLLRTGSTSTHVRVEDVTVTPVTGNPDLSGIQTASVTVQPATGAAVTVAGYQRSATAPTSLVLTGQDVDVEPLLVNGQATFQIALAGQPPAASWTADVVTCLHAQSDVSP